MIDIIRSRTVRPRESFRGSDLTLPSEDTSYIPSYSRTGIQDSSKAKPQIFTRDIYAFHELCTLSDHTVISDHLGHVLLEY